MVIGSTPNSETGCAKLGQLGLQRINHVKEDFQYHWIKRASLLAAHQFERLFARVARAMRAVCCKRFGSNRRQSIFAPQTEYPHPLNRSVPRPVIPLVMVFTIGTTS